MSGFHLHHLLKSLEQLYEILIILPTSQLWMRKQCAWILFTTPICVNLRSRENNLLFVDWNPLAQTWQRCDLNLVRLTLKHTFISVPHMVPRIMASEMGQSLGKWEGMGGARLCGPCCSLSAIWGHWSFLGRPFSLYFPQGLGSRSALDFVPQIFKKKLPLQWQTQDGGAGAGCGSNTENLLEGSVDDFTGPQGTHAVSSFRISTPGCASVSSGGLIMSRALVPEILTQKTRRGPRNLYSILCVGALAMNHCVPNLNLRRSALVLAWRERQAPLNTLGCWVIYCLD